MKKCLTIVLVLVCAFSLFATTALADKMASDDAKVRLYELIEEKLGYTKDQLATNHFGYDNENHRWVMSALVINGPEDEDGIIVFQIDNDGNLAAEPQTPQKRDLSAQLQADIKACYRNKQGYLMLADATEKWAPILDALSQEELEEIYESYAAIIRLGITAPGLGSLPYDEAYQLALTHLEGQPDWSKEKGDMFEMILSCYHTPVDIGRPVYYFYLHRISHSEKNEAKMKNLFGEDAPIEIYLMVDAMDGSLVEAPIFVYPPSEYDSLDYFVRTDEIIEHVKEAAQ